MLKDARANMPFPAEKVPPKVFQYFGVKIITHWVTCSLVKLMLMGLEGF